MRRAAAALLFAAAMLLTAAWTLPEVVNGDAVPEREYIGTFTVTAYCCCPKCCGKNPSDPAYGITATGTAATAGRTIAVDPRIIPYGAVVVIDGEEYTAEDCGSFEGKHIDIYMDCHIDAVNFGFREMEVFA